jgi:hypothetical protein
MKYVMIIAVWMSLLFAPMSSALHIDESVNEVLLGVDCEGKSCKQNKGNISILFSVLILNYSGQLRLPLVESQFNLSESA